jgi:hypothetical protein
LIDKNGARFNLDDVISWEQNFGKVSGSKDTSARMICRGGV